MLITGHLPQAAEIHSWHNSNVHRMYCFGILIVHKKVHRWKLSFDHQNPWKSLLTRIDSLHITMTVVAYTYCFCLCILLTPDPPLQFNSWACFFDLTTNLPTGLSPMRAWIMKPLMVSPAPFPWIFTSIDSFWSELNWFFDKINLYGASDSCGWKK